MFEENRPSASTPDARAAQVRRIIDECVSARGKGEILTDEELLAAHPDLVDELRGELNKLALFARARQRAAEETVAARFTGASPDDLTAAAGGSGIVRNFTGLDALPGYEILGELSRGGQGVVFKALQKSTKREVAIKVLREGPFAVPHDKARFDREIEILGQLKHPHIVTIHDSGAVAGHFYYVMDYIPGQSLDRWIHERQPSNEATRQLGDGGLSKIQNPKSKIREILALFAEICEAVNVAHLRGIIHRDLKPGNIRVDPAGQPHILDFGLAKLSEFDALQDSSAGTMTETGQFVGSLPWAAPEQAEGLPHKIDLRTDVYSLGVILYQMLTDGQFPYPIQGNLADVLNHIRRTEPVPPRRLESHSRRWIDDEVETIVLKCLNKEQARRYQTAGELARDVRHYLNQEPIEAKRDSTFYVLKKTLRRHKGPVAAAALILLTLIGSTIALALMYGNQVHERRRAETNEQKAKDEAEIARRQRAKAERVAEFLAEIFKGVEPAVARGRDTHMLEELLDAARQRIEEGELRAAPEAELRLRLTVGSAYRELAKEECYPKAEAMLRPALEQARALYPGDHPDVALGLNELALLRQGCGDLAEAEPLLREALEMNRRLHPGDHPSVASNLSNLARLLRDRGDLAAAEPLCREDLAMSRRLFPGDHLDVATSLNNLASLLHDRGDLAAAEPLYREALEMDQRMYRGDHPALARTLNNLASLLEDRGDLAAAEPLFRETLAMRRRLYPGDHPAVATGLNNLAAFLRACGDPAAAEPLYREALDMQRRLFPGDHPSVALNLSNLALFLQRQGNLAAAEPLCREALNMQRRLFPGDHPDVALGLNNLASLREDQGDLAAAEALYREALAMRRRLFPGEHLAVADSLHNLATLLHNRGDLAAAEPLYREALDMTRRFFPGDHPDVASSLANLAYLLKDRGDAAAEPLLREALAMRRRLFSGDHPDVANSLNNLASLLKDSGHLTNAEPLLREALDMHRRLFPGGHPSVADSLNSLAALLETRHDFAAAEPLYREALAIRRNVLPSSHWLIGSAANGLGRCLAGLRRFDETEPALLEAAAIFQQAQGVPQKAIVDNWRALLRLYDAWHAAAPDKGYDAKAAEWRAKLEEWRASTQPASQPAAPPALNPP